MWIRKNFKSFVFGWLAYSHCLNIWIEVTLASRHYVPSCLSWGNNAKEAIACLQSCTLVSWNQAMHTTVVLLIACPAPRFFYNRHFVITRVFLLVFLSDHRLNFDCSVEESFIIFALYSLSEVTSGLRAPIFAYSVLQTKRPTATFAVNAFMSVGRNFSKGAQRCWNFILPTPKPREKHFYTKRFITKYQNFTM